MSKNVKKNPGRPANPYSEREWWWKPGATRDWFDANADLASVLPPASVKNNDIRWYAYGLIMQLEVPVLRRVIESMLVFDHGFKPEAVTAALDKLVAKDFIDGRNVVRTEVERGDARPTYVYSYKRKPTSGELKYLHEASEERDGVLTIQTLKDAGERYVRSMLVASGRYSGITQASRLGSVALASGEHALDLVATEESTGYGFGISVKNQREWLYSGDKGMKTGRAIRDCYTKAKEHGLQPWLVVPFASESAIERCERDGIRLTVLGRQILPALDAGGHHMRRAVEGLRSVIGPQPYDYLYARFDRTLKQSAAARSDVDAV